MSTNLKSQSHYLKVLMDNNREINKAIFRNISKKLLNAVVEIVYNVWRLPLNTKQRGFFERRIKTLCSFINEKKKRKIILRRNNQLFSILLRLLRKYIFSILEENE